MQRLFTVVSIALVSGLALTGCPEKKAEKEEPATADTPAAADPDPAEEKADEKAEENAEDKAEDKEDPDKEEGGW
jgi:hypothetical protein